jgi:integrase/recombinase XerD
MENSGCRPLTDAECVAMHRAFRINKYAARDAAMFEIGIRTGFRTSEILSIKVGDVYRDGRMKASVTVDKCWMKGGKNSRTMPLHAAASAAVFKWILEAGFTAPEFADQPLFCRQHTKRRLTRAQAWAIIKSAAIRAGLDIERVAGHSLRKTFARNMWDSAFVQKDMARMARLLGHQNFSNTLRYLEFLDDSLENAVLAA